MLRTTPSSAPAKERGDGKPAARSAKCHADTYEPLRQLRLGHVQAFQVQFKISQRQPTDVRFPRRAQHGTQPCRVIGCAGLRPHWGTCQLVEAKRPRALASLRAEPNPISDPALPFSIVAYPGPSCQPQR